MTNKRQEEEFNEIHFYVLQGSLSDLSYLDFSKYNARVLKVSDPEFKLFLDRYPSPQDPDYNWEIFKEMYDELHGTQELYVLFPKNIQAQYSEQDILLCFKVMLLLFPSDLTITYIVSFQIIDKNTLHYCGDIGYDFHSTGIEDYYDNFIYINDKFLDEINEFINLFKLRYKRISFAKNALDSYLNSFRASDNAQAYLNLCICLESIIEGTTEISYRIKHHIALLCSDNKESAEIIFNNLNKIYTLRSKIIHGETYSLEKIEDYLPYLRCLVSRMIIEIILLNVPERKKLDNILTFSGYNKKPNLSRDYKNMTLNITSFVNTFTNNLK